MAGSDDNQMPGNRPGGPPRNPQAAMVPAPEFLSLTFTLPYHLIQQVSDLAQDTNRSQSEIIAESIRLYMKAWATRQERTRISTFEGFTYQEVAIADATVEDAPPGGEIPQHAEPRHEPAAPAPAVSGGNGATRSDPESAATPPLEENGHEDDAAAAARRQDAAAAEAPGRESDTAEQPETLDATPDPGDSDEDVPEEKPTAMPATPIDDVDDDAESTAAQVEGTPQVAAADSADDTADEVDGDAEQDSAAPASDEGDDVLQIADPASEVRARLQEIAGEALDSSKLRSELEDIMYEVDMKDFSPPEHSLKVARMARDLAEAKGLRGERLLRVFMAGLVHDIGKACIPDEIIKKPRPSTDEMALIRKYPEFGLDLLGLVDSLEPVTAIVAAHQERWNGSGYPMGLARDDIPMEAQIVALCDVYDVLLTERRYRPAYPEDRARQIIEQNVGTLWNPDVANIFLKKILDPQGAATNSRS